MISKIFLMIFVTLTITFKEKKKMEIEKIDIGDCFTYGLKGNEQCQYGFVVVNIYKQSKYIECALVILPNNHANNIAEFKKGELYANKSYLGKGISGVFCYEFRENSSDILRKFKAVGNIILDSKKFIVGSGGDAMPEPTFSMCLKNHAFINANKNKIFLLQILAE
jgi:hypothetical protein